MVITDLNKINWLNTFIEGNDMTSINANFENFSNIVKDSLNCHMPLRKINLNKL